MSERTKQKVKEKITREIRVLIQPSLYEQLQEKCDKEYKTLSQVIRELVVKYINE